MYILKNIIIIPRRNKDLKQIQVQF